MLETSNRTPHYNPLLICLAFLYLLIATSCPPTLGREAHKDIVHNQEYIRYLKHADRVRDDRLPVRNVDLQDALQLHEAVTLAHLTKKSSHKRLLLWEKALEQRLQKLHHVDLTREESLVAYGVRVDYQLAQRLGNQSTRTWIPSLLHLEECGADLTFNRVFTRYAKAVVMEDDTRRGAVLLELQNALSCMSATQVDIYASALGWALAQANSDHQATHGSARNNLQAIRGVALNPSLLVLDAVKHRGHNALLSYWRETVEALGDALILDRYILLYDVFSGNLIAFEHPIIAELIADLLDPYNIGTGQCGFSEMGASAVANGSAACGRGVSGCSKGESDREQKTAFGIDHADLSDNCSGAGAGEGGGGGPIAGKGYGACVIETMLGARNSGNAGYANCMLARMHGRQKARLGSSLNPLDGIHANPECTNPRMSGGDSDNLPDDWQEGDYDDVDAQDAIQAIREQHDADSPFDYETDTTLAQEKENAAEGVESSWGRCVVDHMIEEVYGAYGRNEYAEDCQAEAATQMRSATDHSFSANTNQRLAEGSATLGDTNRNTDAIRIDMMAHEVSAAMERRSWARDTSSVEYVTKLHDTLIHEGMHVVHNCAYQASMLDSNSPDNSPTRARTEEQEHTLYGNALDACEGEVEEGTAHASQVLPPGPDGPDGSGTGGNMCTPYAEAMNDFMECTGFLDARSGVSGLDANGKVIEGGVLDPTFGQVLPQDPYSGANGRGVLACSDTSNANGIGGRVAVAADKASEDCKAMLCGAEQTNCPCLDGQGDSLPFALADKANVFGSSLCETSDFCLNDPDGPSAPTAPVPICTGLTCGVNYMIDDFHGGQLDQRVEDGLPID